MEIQIKNETEKDYREVEELTREAFWNLYVPGADEHFIVHNLRKSKNFIKHLDLVAVHQDKIVGSIIYTLSYIEDEFNQKHEVITFVVNSSLHFRQDPYRQMRGISSDRLFLSACRSLPERSYRRRTAFFRSRGTFAQEPSAFPQSHGSVRRLL